jgi:hypothetical protein
VVHGRNDISLPAITACELARAWPGVEFIIVDDAGHTGSVTLRDAREEGRARRENPLRATRIGCLI